MSRLVVIADPETALGFQMAGFEVMSGDALETATAQLEQLLSDPTVGLVAVSATLIAKLNDGMRRRIENSYQPVVVTLPAGGPTAGFVTRREYLTALIQRAIGFHLTFAEGGRDEPQIVR